MKLRNKKTGEIGVINLKVYGDDAEHVYDKLETLYEDWEDNVPIEPLIKDEKVSKVVIAWAEVNNLSSVLYNKDEDCLYSPYGSDDNDLSISISFDEFGVFKGLEHKKEYTIEELCGNEE